MRVSILKPSVALFVPAEMYVGLCIVVLAQGDPS